MWGGGDEEGEKRRQGGNRTWNLPGTDGEYGEKSNRIGPNSKTKRIESNRNLGGHDSLLFRIEENARSKTARVKQRSAKTAVGEKARNAKSAGCFYN